MTLRLKLNTPVKRFFFLILLVGVLMELLTVTVFFINQSSDIHWVIVQVEYFHVRALVRYWQKDAYQIYRVAFWIGALLIALGIFGSIYYDKTFGRLVSWVRLGHDNKVD